MVRALLYTNSAVLASGFSAVLDPATGIQAETFIGDLSQLLQNLAENRPDILLLDVGPDFDCSVIGDLSRRAEGCRIVLWVQSISVEVAHHARNLGVRGILRKELPNELLIRCIRKVAEGELWFERVLLTSLLTVREIRLSPRERQLVRLISQGMSNKQIAGELLISEGTIKVYISKLFRKLGVNDRFDIALYGLRNFGTAAIEHFHHEQPTATLLPSVVIRERPGTPTGSSR